MYKYNIRKKIFNIIRNGNHESITTLTTVEYGDIHPVFSWKQVISMISAILGIVIIALPSGIITASYLKELENKQ